MNQAAQKTEILFRSEVAQPFFSVVTCVYKENLASLERSFKSILEQTFRNFEFIVVVDNPGNSEAIEYAQTLAKKDKRMAVLVNKGNFGAAISANIGIGFAKGEYIARHDSDDESDRERLAKQYEKLQESPSIDVLGTALSYIDNESDKLIFRRYYSEEPKREMNRICAVANPTVAIRRQVFETHGGYNETKYFYYAEDYEMWLRWSRNGVVFRNLPEDLYKYYQCKTNIKSLSTRKQLIATTRVKRKYACETGFSIADYAYLCLEMILSLMPGPVILKMFFLVNRLKNIQWKLHWRRLPFWEPRSS
jgi:glycosyltransferase involved in cell wall biosynthesis